MRVKAKEWTRVTVTYGGPWTGRRICTYVNGVPCATIKKPVINSQNSKYVLNSEGLNFFASDDKEKMPGLKIRFLQLVR